MAREGAPLPTARRSRARGVAAVASSCAALLVAPVGARAEDPPAPGSEPAARDPRERARELAERGRQLFESGQAERALPLAQEAYELDPDPVLLYNIARGYEQLGDLARAIESYRRFLVASPNVPARAAIEQRVATLGGLIEEREALERRLKKQLQEPPSAQGRWVGLGGGALGIGAVGLITGAALWALAANRHADALSPAASGVETFAAQGQGQSFATAGNVVFAAGAVVAAAGVVGTVLALRSRRIDLGPRSYALGPALGPGWLGCVGRF
jgi:hypothetical protein